MALVRDTVAIPVAKGIDVNTPARLVDAQELLEAQNVRFTAKVGARKRRGMAGQPVRGAKSIPAGWTQPGFSKSDFVQPFSTDDRNFFADWLPGYGYVSSSEVADITVPLPSSSYPDGIALGAATRDNELLTWDGNRLLSCTNLDLPGGQFTEFNAVLPSLRSEPFAKANIAQNTPDVADNGTLRVAAWVTGSRAYYSVFDSLQGTAIVAPTLLDPPDAVAVRVIPVGGWIHILIADTNTGTLQLRSLHSSTPSLLHSRTLGDCEGYFDVWKMNDTAFVVAQTQAADVAVRIFLADGSIAGTWNAGIGAGVTSVAIAVQPVSTTFGIAWRTATQVQARCFNLDGSPNGAAVVLGAVTSATRAVAIAPKYLRANDNTDDVFNVYWDDWTTYATLNIARFTKTDGVVYSESKFHLLIGSQGFRVGDRTFIWAARNSAYQSSWILLDESLNSVGRAEYVVANTPVGTDTAHTPFSVNWHGEAPDKHRSVYHCALSTRVRVPVEQQAIGINAPAVYSEPYIKFVQLDFLPRLRSAQAGRTTYFAGAQLWAYDGAEMTEANFLLAPEDVSITNDPTAGSLVDGGIYTWRVDLCYRNAQNEEIRSASFYTTQYTLTGATSAKLTIPTSLTRRENAYLLIFRNEDHGTVWYLCNSRDPSSAQFLRNDQSVREVTYVDSVSDASLISREQHTNQSVDHLDPFAAPPSEVIAAGRNRLWLAGGEITPGQIYPSRLFAAGEVPAFHADLLIEVDRTAEPITAIGFVGEYTVFFRRTHNYISDDKGPDNEMSSDWADPRRSDTAGIGALSPESVVEAAGGIVFQSAAGIRLFSPGGSIVPFGANVDKISKTMNIAATVVVGKDQEVRFYDWDGTTLVFNYLYGTWSTWTVSAAGAVLDPQSGLAVVVTPDGTFLREQEDLWTDNGAPYRMRVRFAWLRAGNLLDWQQVRRIGAVGEAAGDHSVHVEVFYNEREFAEEIFDWNYPDETQNNDTFGAGSFGDGNFGDTSAVERIQFRDVTWPWRRRLFRRKCSVISVAIDDNYTNGEGFTLTALALELAKKPGLAKLPWLGGSFNNTGSNGSSNTGN